jgi:ribosomal protein S18 acetylase RimI-like enzyme
MGQYTISEEKLPRIYSELEPLFRAHYQQMSERLCTAQVVVPEYCPRLDEYFRAADAGWLKTFVLRCDGKACGYALVYVTNDMHNGELIAQEDVLFVSPEHRNGVGKKLVQFGVEFLRALGVKRLSVSAVTDLRVAKLWKRMGFKETAVQMTYTF